MSDGAAKRNAVRHRVEQCIFPVAKWLNRNLHAKGLRHLSAPVCDIRKACQRLGFLHPRRDAPGVTGTQHGYPAAQLCRAGKGARQVRAQVARFRSVQIKAARNEPVKAGYIQSGFCTCPLGIGKPVLIKGSQPCQDTFTIVIAVTRQHLPLARTAANTNLHIYTLHPGMEDLCGNQ